MDPIAHRSVEAPRVVFHNLLCNPGKEEKASSGHQEAHRNSHTQESQRLSLSFYFRELRIASVSHLKFIATLPVQKFRNQTVHFGQQGGIVLSRIVLQVLPVRRQIEQERLHSLLVQFIPVGSI